MSRTTITEGNHRVVVFDPDEPIEGYKKKTWVPPAEWGPGKVVSEGVIRPNSPRPMGNDRFLGGSGAGSNPGVFHAMAVPYETLHFEKGDIWIRRLIRPCHGYDVAPVCEQPDFNADDLCP
jgi:hypothetical protein